MRGEGRGDEVKGRGDEGGRKGDRKRKRQCGKGKTLWRRKGYGEREGEMRARKAEMGR